MADNETVADIIAEMRALSNPISDSIIAINGRSIADRLEAAFKREKSEAEADALAAGGIVEASRKRVLSKTRENDNNGTAVYTNDNNGNAAAMREALKPWIAFAEWLLENAGKDGLGKAIQENGPIIRQRLEELREALAAPRRNCDVGTVGEQEARFFAFCKNHDCTANCPVKKKWNFEWGHNPSCGVLFSQMPYEEGDAK